MKAAILSFTANGRKTAGKVRKALSAEDWLVGKNGPENIGKYLMF